ncbi:MAG: peptidoglycan DD-metalloendopeptidase family protein [Patescibacteria group bacterium]
MKYSTFKLVILMAIFILPTLAFAATSTSTRYSYFRTLYNTDGSAESSTTRQIQIRQYRGQSSELQKKISALPDTSDKTVSMPVLFGVGISDISPNFGDPRSDGRTHEGEDIMAVLGTPIVSPTEAVVIRTGVGETEGNYVYTANPGGETFVYMHLDHIGEGIVSGLVLEAGDLIGYVGDTGNAAGGPAHLHFEIHDNSGTPVDPFPRLTKELSLEDKIDDLTQILKQTTDEDKLSKFLVKNFRSVFIDAKNESIELPQPIVDAIDDLNIIPANGSSGLLLSRDLYLGITGDDVYALQVWLNNHGFVVSQSGAGSIGNETRYFGSATRAAVIKFQIAHTIAPIVGYVGSITRRVLALL